MNKKKPTKAGTQMKDDHSASRIADLLDINSKLRAEMHSMDKLITNQHIWAKKAYLALNDIHFFIPGGSQLDEPLDPCYRTDPCEELDRLRKIAGAAMDGWMQ